MHVVVTLAWCHMPLQIFIIAYTASHVFWIVRVLALVEHALMIQCIVNSTLDDDLQCFKLAQT